MRVLMLETPTALLDERARRGLDIRDEMWDGVLHVVPAPYLRHQRLELRLAMALDDAVTASGLEITPESNLDRPGRTNDYRVPDLVIFHDSVATERGVDGAAHVVIEIRSPDDESYEKIPWYLDVGVQEVVIIDRDTLAIEVFRALDLSTGEPVLADDTVITSLGVTLERVDDDHLAVVHPDGRRTEVSL